MDRIVVGVDGSEASQRALAWAVDEARRRGDAAVEVVYAWEPPVLVAGPVGTAPAVPMEAPYDHAARQVLADAVAGIDTAGAEVTQVVIEGPPGAALCEHAAAAALLVVGSSGHGAVLDALLGSVSQYCAHHARCPLVLIPTAKRKK